MLTPIIPNAVLGTRDIGPTYDRNLYALRRQDPSIMSITSRFSHAQCELDGGVSITGKMVIYEREAYPTRGFAILKDNPSRDILYIQNLCSEDDLSLEGQHVVVTSRPHSLAHRWSLFEDPPRFASFDALLDGSPHEQVSAYILVDDDDFFALSSSLQSAIRESAFIPTATKKSLRILTPLSTISRSLTTFNSPMSPLESPPLTSRFDMYDRGSPFTSPPRSIQSSPFQSSFVLPSETVDKAYPSPTEDQVPVRRDSDSSRLALLQKVFGEH